MSVIELAKEKEKERSEPMLARICVQEHWQKEANVADLQAACRKKGWIAAIAAATCGPRGGASAGVAVLAPTRTAPGLVLGHKEDESPPGSKGRLATSCGNGVLPGGIYASSCYLWTNEVNTMRNRTLLFKALENAFTSGMPWLIGLDANQTPEELSQWAAAAIGRAKGVIIAPDGPTHFPAEGGEARTIDYFIVSTALER